MIRHRVHILRTATLALAAAITITTVAGGPDPTHPLSTIPRASSSGAPRDVNGNPVLEGDRRLNYVLDDGGGLRAVDALTEAPVATVQLDSPIQDFSEPTRVAETVSGLGPLSTTVACGAKLNTEWKATVFGTGIGGSLISVYDLDSDGTLEMIMGGSMRGYFWRNDFFYVVKATDPDSYAQTRSSDVYSSPDYSVTSTSIDRITVGDPDQDGRAEIFVALDNFSVEVFDGPSFSREAAFFAFGTKDVVLADVDGDGDTELLTSDGTSLFAYSAVAPFNLEWRTTDYGGYDIAVGNVDADPTPEIVSARGYVLDGTTRAVEWHYVNGFGARVALGDFDGDAMQEIIGAAAWYKVTAFDADIRSPKWEIPYQHDIAAMNAADIDGDAVPEVLIGEGQWGGVYAHDGATGAVKWSIANPEHGVTDVVAGDVDGDGGIEVIWGAGWSSTGPDYLFISNVATRSREWQSQHLDGPFMTEIADVDNDGQVEIVAASLTSDASSEGGVVQVFDGATHNLEWTSTPDPSDWMGATALSLGDVDDDGRMDIVVASSSAYDGYLIVYDGVAHNRKYETPWYDGNYFSALAIGDLNGDGFQEIVAGQGRVHTGATGVYLLVFDGRSGVELWRSIDLAPGFSEVYDIEIADVDNDGRAEIVASVYTGSSDRLYVYDGVTHQLDWLSETSALPLVIRDMDGDSLPEIIAGQPGGVIEIFDGVSFEQEETFTLGSYTLLGLAIEDIDLDGAPDWITTNGSSVAICDGVTRTLRAINADTGPSPGIYDHLQVDDMDSDGDMEIVAGSEYGVRQFSSQVSPNDPPVAEAGGPYTVVVGRSIVLDASGSSDPEGSPLTYAWDFLTDGILDWVGTTSSVSHYYPYQGTFTATLLLSDGDGGCASDTATVQAIANRGPRAEAGGPYSGLVGHAIQFDGSGSTDPEGDALQYQWDFDLDGQYENTGASAVTTHTYTRSGAYVARLRVLDSFGYSNTDTAWVTISGKRIIVSGPNGGESAPSSSSLPITWQATPECDTVRLLYSLNPKNKPWITIAAGVDAADGSWDWTVPVVLRTYPKAKVKIIAYRLNGTKVGSDVSDRPFTIHP